VGGVTIDHEAYLLEEHCETMAQWQAVAVLLRRLSVKELRVLMAHYCGGKPSDYSDLNKSTMIEEIAPEYAREQFS
jgi:hypothetical protein